MIFKHSRLPRPAAGLRAMTLVELLVAMAILVTVSASTAFMFRGVTRAWKAGELRTERYQQARLLLDLMARELTSSIPSPRYPMVGTQASDGQPLQEGSVADEVWFVGTLPGRGSIVERGYWLNEAGELMCHDQEPADGDYATGFSELCGRDVTAFEVSFFDSGQWLETWDARSGEGQEGRLPKAIRVVLTIGRQASESFETVVYLPTS